MNPTLFVEFVKKWFKVLAGAITEKVNGGKTSVTYLFKTMLTPKLSADNKWDSTSVSKSIVAADIVALDSPLPIKKRDKIGTAGGKIPKLGMKMSKTESLISEIRILQMRGAAEAEIVRAIFDDLGRCVTGVYERLEFAFLQALSTGITLIDDEDNTGAGIRLQFGYDEGNRFGAVKKWGKNGYTPISDIERIISSAGERGDVITTIALDRASYNLIRQSDEAKARYAGSIGNYTGNNQVIPTPSQFDAFIADEYKVRFLVIDRVIRVEKNGKQKPVRPFAENTLVFLTTEKVGSLVYGILAEEDTPVAGVEYQKVDGYILTSKYSKNEPLAEFTSAQAIALPVIENVDSIYILNTQEAVEMEVGEVEGDAGITIYGITHSKQSVIDALKTTGARVAHNISDEKLIEKINGLSNADEDVFRAALDGVLVVTPVELTFSSVADTTGKTITANASGTVTATSDQSWATVTVSGNIVTVKVTANTSVARTANITITADGKQAIVAVIQVVA
jgi:hypothetical protein